MNRQFLMQLSAVILAGISSGLVFCDNQPASPAAATTPSTAASEMVDNPQFATWSAFRGGTSIKIETITITGKTSTTNVAIQTLKEASPEKLVIEIKTTTTMPGKDKQIERTRKMTVPAKIPKVVYPQNRANVKELGKGQEDVKIGEKTYTCDWTEIETAIQMKNKLFVSRTKTWNCKDIPGGMVKMEVSNNTGEGENSPISEYKTQIVEVRIGG